MSYDPAKHIGQKFGRLIVLRLLKERTKNRQIKAECQCDCGKKTETTLHRLRSGATKSCGCLMLEISHIAPLKHGYARKNKSRTWRIWRNMRTRCNNENSTNYKNYGQRGITVCQRWEKFENFLADMGEAPEGMSIERKDNDKGYAKNNCKWATRKEQGRNCRTNKLITHQGKTLPLSAWAENMKLRPNTINWRIRNGWSVSQAFHTPIGEKRT